MNNKDSRYDLPALGGSQGWNADLAYGHSGEALVTEFLDALTTGAYEVKSDRWRNGRCVVETEQNPKKKGWKPSGLMVTEAKWFVYVFSPEGAFIIVEVGRLKRYIATLPAERLRTFVPASTNPTKGFLLEPEEVTDLMSNTKYDL